MTLMKHLAGAALLLSLAPAHADGPVLQSTSTCQYTNGICLEFSGSSAAVLTARTITFNAPSAGTALVSVTGSGVCANQGPSTQVADFSTEITTPSANPDYTKPGGNRFEFTLPPLDPNTGISSNGVFNLSSQRLFSIAKAGVQRYALRIGINRIDMSPVCDVVSVAMNVLFLPG